MDVIVERRGSTELVTLNRPARGNSIAGTLLQDVLWAAEAADADDGVRAIVTTGAGSTYCVGGDRGRLTELAATGAIDLGELGPAGVGGAMGLPEFSSHQRRTDHLGSGTWVKRFLDVGAPTVAAINGGTAGGGLALAMLHDVRIAARTALLAANLVALGVAPEMGLSWLLPRAVNWPTAFDVLTRTRPMCAEEALELGLVDQVVEPEELIDASMGRAEELGRLPPLAYRTCKRLLRQSGEATLETQLEREWTAMGRLLSAEETLTTLRSVLGT